MAEPGRPREFEMDDVLEDMMNTFWDKGYEGTSLSDLIKATGLKKGSLYAAFGEKREMYLRAIAHHEDVIVDIGSAELRKAEDPVGAIKGFLTAPIDAVWKQNDRRGCFLCNASADQAATDPATEAIVRKGFTKLEAALRDTVQNAFPEWDKAKATSTARYLLTIYSGLRVMSRSALPRAQMEDARDTALRAAFGDQS